MATAKKSTAKRKTAPSRKVTSGGGGLSLNKRINSPLLLLVILLAAVAGGMWVWKSFAATTTDYVYLQTYLTDGNTNYNKKLTRIAVDGSTSKEIYNQQSASAPTELRTNSVAEFSASPSGKYVEVVTYNNSGTKNYEAVTVDTATGKVVNRMPKSTSYPGYGQFEWLANEKGVFASIKYGHAVNGLSLDGSLSGSGYFLADRSYVSCVSSLPGTDKMAFTWTDSEIGSGGLDSIVAMGATSAANFSSHAVAEESRDGASPKTSCPFWAPSGKQLAFSVGNKDTSASHANGVIYLADPNYQSDYQNPGLSPRTQLTEGNMQPQLTGGRKGGVNLWSPDGKSLLFTKQTSGGVENLYKINIATKAITQISDNQSPKPRYTMYGYTPGGWVVFAYEDQVAKVDGLGQTYYTKSSPAIVKSVNPNGSIKKTLYKEPPQSTNNTNLYLDQMDF